MKEYLYEGKNEEESDYRACVYKDLWDSGGKAWVSDRRFTYAGAHCPAIAGMESVGFCAGGRCDL